MSFDDLPIDLKNIVSEFAYFVKWKTVLKDLETCEKIKKMQLSSVFSREVMWSRMYREYIPTHFTHSNRFVITRANGKTTSTGIRSKNCCGDLISVGSL